MDLAEYIRHRLEPLEGQPNNPRTRAKIHEVVEDAILVFAMRTQGQQCPHCKKNFNLTEL